MGDLHWVTMISMIYTMIYHDDLANFTMVMLHSGKFAQLCLVLRCLNGQSSGPKVYISDGRICPSIHFMIFLMGLSWDIIGMKKGGNLL